MAEANSINAATTGIVGNTGTSFTGSPVTNHNVIIGGSTSSTLSNAAPSATSGVPLISNGSSADPSFGTAVVSGGGTGSTSFTAYAPICGGTTTTGILQSADTGISTSGYLLTSNGSSSLPSFQALSLPAASCAFWAYVTTDISNVTGDGTTYTVVFDNIVQQNGSAYNNTTGQFTAPATGWYVLNASVTLINLSTSFTGCQIDIYDITTATSIANISICNPGAVLSPAAGLTNYAGFSGGGVAYLISGAVVGVTVYVSGSTKTVGIKGATISSFSAARLL